MIGLSGVAIAHRRGKGALYRQTVDALAAGVLITAPFTIPAQTDRVLVSLSRPTTAAPLAWTNTGIVRVSLVVTVDGVPHRFTGQATGGIRTHRLGQEIAQYALVCQPTWGYFGLREGMPRRLGEGASSYTAHVELERLSGSITTELEVTNTSSQAPQVPFHSSVAFDTATDAQELSGDGVLSLSHTAGGSDRAAFAGVALSAGSPPTSTSVTYNAVAMTEVWDPGIIASFFGNAGYALSAPTTGAQTVTSTLSGTTDEQFLGVITVTGAHQTTASLTGTPQTTNTGSGTTSATVTVASVGADDLVIDNLYVTDVPGAPTAGADQTGRNAEVASTTRFAQSTQLGSTGGVMSWTFGSCFASTLGAVAFKPAAGGGGATILRQMMNQHYAA